MKSLVRKITLSNLGIKLRNFLNFKPIYMNTNHLYKNCSVSDSFCWRTDNNYETIFKYSDILGLFYKIKKSYVELSFFSKNNLLLKTLVIDELDYSNQLIINKKFLNGIEDYGVFYIHHYTDIEIREPTIISNRCYIGFSKNGCLHSYMHGNSLVRVKDLKGKKKGLSDIVKTSFFNNNVYRVQNFFDDLTTTELFFSNPTYKDIVLYLERDKYTLKKGECLIINTNKKSIINIKSNCFFLRPIIFNYKDQYIDVYHG
jgi:hypothetical protein